MFIDDFGNRCCRLVAPAGAVTLSVEGWLDDDGDLDPIVPQAIQHPIEDLPLEALPFLVASRYCESDLLSNEAWRLFGDVTPGWSRAQAVCDWVHGHISFGYGYSNVDRTAADALAVGRGVCRDYAHLFVAFCRGLNMPTRYCTGYLSFIGEPEPHAPGISPPGPKSISVAPGMSSTRATTPRAVVVSWLPADEMRRTSR